MGSVVGLNAADGFWFFINLFRDVDAVSSAAIFIYPASFMLCFLSIYIGLAEFVENKKLLRLQYCLLRA